MSKFGQVGDFCSNEACPDYGKPQSDHQRNIIKFGKISAIRQRFRCKTCGATFTETMPEDEIIETLALIAEGSRISTLGLVRK